MKNKFVVSVLALVAVFALQASSAFAADGQTDPLAALFLEDSDSQEDPLANLFTEEPSGPKCTGGRVESGDSCVCPSSTTWDSDANECVKPSACESPNTLVNGKCVAPVVCDAGTTMGTDGKCYPDVVCPAGTLMGDDGQCYKPAPLPKAGPTEDLLIALFLAFGVAKGRKMYYAYAQEK